VSGAVCHVNTSGIGTADWIGYPKLTFPDFSDPVHALLWLTFGSMGFDPQPELHPDVRPFQ